MNPTIQFVSVAGVLAGIAGICLAVIAQQRASRAVRECSELVRGAVGSHGTADPRALRDIGIVRYDALHEMSGQMSFSLALLNALGDGIVVSSINGRAETRTYAKTVQAGEGVQELSPEENAAIRAAKLGLNEDDAHARYPRLPIGQASGGWGSGGIPRESTVGPTPKGSGGIPRESTVGPTPKGSSPG